MKLTLTFSHKATWTALASEEMIEITWYVVEEPAVWVSKKETSCLRTDFRYSILILEVCLSAVRVQHNPSVEVVSMKIGQVPVLIKIFNVSFSQKYAR